jgi:endoglucanase
LFFNFIANGQTHTPRYNTIDANCGGYYEYLPQGYSSNTWQSYPLIVYMHGVGETGNGTTDLGKIINSWTPLPRVIENGAFPTSFSVNGQSFSFIVISPQFKGWPAPSDVNDVINYAVQNYRIDQSRIYVTGMSMGGGAAWDFAAAYPNRAAAVVPVCGASGPNSTGAQAIANAKLAVWGTHNLNDNMVPSSNTTGWVSMINQYGGDAISTIWPYTGHDAWSTTYSPTFTQNGVNIYQWMLQHQKGGSTTTTPPPAPAANQLPTANAGANQTITLPTSSVSLTGTGSDPDGSIVSYQWSQASGPSQAMFLSTSWANTSVSGLIQGTYVFALKVTDNTGGTGTSNVTITVNAAASSLTGGTTTTTTSSRIEAENYSNMSGIQTENTQDAGGGKDVGWIDNGDWMDYSVNVSSAGTYGVSLRLAAPFTGGQLQIKNSAGSVLATVNIPYTGGFQTWQTVSANISLAAGTQTIRVQSTSNAGFNFNWMDIVSGSASAATTKTSSVQLVAAPTTSAEMGVYPNPVRDKFQLQINNSLTGKVTVQIYDMQGGLQKQFSLTKADTGTVQFYLSIGELAAANYIIKATMSSWSQSKEVIKQ